MSGISQTMTAMFSSPLGSCARIMEVLRTALDGVGRRLWSEEEKQVSRLLLPPRTIPIRRFYYFYRLIRYAGFSRMTALSRAFYWTL